MNGENNGLGVSFVCVIMKGFAEVVTFRLKYKTWRMSGYFRGKNMFQIFELGKTLRIERIQNKCGWSIAR